MEGQAAAPVPRAFPSSNELSRFARCVVSGRHGTGGEPLQIHPDKPKYFLFRSKPLVLVTVNAGPVVVSALGVEGRDYIGYLADSREVSDSRTGEPLSGEITLVLPVGRFAVSLYSPLTGLYSPAIRVAGGGKVTLELAPFRHDLAIRAVALP